MLAGNLGLFLIKGLAWYVSGSLAVGSEAINSLADSAYSIVVVGGLYWTTKPADPDHPHGHERIEPFISLLIGGSMIGVAAALIYGAGQTMLNGTPTSPAGPTAVLALVVTLGVKYALYRYCIRAGQAEDSPALIATGEDNRNDMLTASGALLGVIGAQSGYPILDPIAAMIVAVFIAYTGLSIGRRNFRYLIGAAPPPDLREEIIARATAHPNVTGVHDVIAHYVGPEVDVSLHIEVEGAHTFRDAHDIETDVVTALEEIDRIDEAFVHVDPREEWHEEESRDRTGKA